MVTKMLAFYERLFLHHSEGLHNFRAEYLDMGFGLILANTAKSWEEERDMWWIRTRMNRKLLAYLTLPPTVTSSKYSACCLTRILNLKIFFFFFSFFRLMLT